MKRNRHVLEGTWSGYRSSQRRVCHRVVITKPELYKHLKTIVFSDGTELYITLRACKPREKVEEIKGYTSVINMAAKLNKDRVLVSELEINI